jgi:branched-chain amino acid transport system substrate-binding protein
MGGVSSSVAISVGAVCQEGGALFIASNENSDVITGEQARPNVFRTGFSMAFAVRAPAQWVADNLGKKWYFITHDYSWGWSGTRWARKMIPEVGAEELGEVKVPLGTRDFSSYLMKVANSDADVAVITVGGVDGIALYRQLTEFGIFDKMDVWWTSIDYADAYALEPEQRGRHGNSETYYKFTPEMKAFSDRYAEEYPNLNVRVADNNTHHGWLSMTALLRGMDKAGSTDVSDVKNAMEGMTIEDNKLPDPTYIRPWDHQMLDTFFFGQDKKRPNPDFFDVIFSGKEADYARSQEENPVSLDETPFP